MDWKIIAGLAIFVIFTLPFLISFSYSTIKSTIDPSVENVKDTTKAAAESVVEGSFPWVPVIV